MRRWTASALATAALLAAGCSSDTVQLQPLDWQRVAGDGPAGAVLGLGAPGDFDARGNFTVRALEEGGVTSLYYGGSDAADDPACPPATSPTSINATHWRIGLARSVDGVHFDRVRGSAPGGAILDVRPGRFDSQLTYRPFVLHDGDTWRMWYNGSTQPFNCGGRLALDRKIGYAESRDGVAWERVESDGPDGSVLPLGGPNDIDAQQVGYAWVLKDGPQYKMYYSANSATNTWRVALAVSSDARRWTKVRGKAANGSILDVGPLGAFDQACAYQPSVVKESDRLYRMWYRGCQQAAPGGGPSLGVIGYAESNDGITWVKIPQGGPGGAALAQGPAGAFDAVGLTTPSVFLQGDTWNMYYAGFDAAGRFLTGLARAPRR